MMINKRGSRIDQKGITLVALVVTIIVLLILAGVTLSIVLGNSGIFANADLSRKNYNMQAVKEKIEFEIMDLAIIKRGQELTFNEISDRLIEKEIAENGAVDEETQQVITKDGYIAQIRYEDGVWIVDMIDLKTISGIIVRNTIYPDVDQYSPEKTIRLTAIDSMNGIKKITMPNGTEKTYDNLKMVKEEYTVHANGIYTFTIENSKGQTKTHDVEALNIDVGSIAIVAEKGINEWTNENVEVEVLWPEDIDSLRKEISIDNGATYSEYTGKIEVENNCIVKARLLYNSQVVKEAEPLEISKIDKELPEATVGFTEYKISDVVMGVTGTIASTDNNKSGVNYSKSKYVITDSNTPIGTDPSSYTGGSITDSSVSFSKTKKAGTYYLHTLVEDNANNKKEIISSNSVVVVGKKNFGYTGNAQNITLPEGNYMLEVWGAQGGNSDAYTGGKGGYSKGTINVTNSINAYIYVGGQGVKTSSNNSTNNGGYNGGGFSVAAGSAVGASGGGGTDIRINSSSLYARVIVAGGGGGAGQNSNNGNGFVGGGTSGLGSNIGSTGTVSTSSTYNTSGGGPGTQTAGGNSYQYNGYDAGTTAGSFGKGGGHYATHTSNTTGGGGGGGWYGGGGAAHSAGGGGSGYVYTSSTKNNYPSGCLLNSSYYLTSASTIAGNSSFPSTSSGNETGHAGNGYARITCLD